jgi:tRNA (cmo5U34)-methyltransferase
MRPDALSPKAERGNSPPGSDRTWTGRSPAPLAVGDRIPLRGARWSFGGATAQHFDEHAQKSIPGYAEGHRLVEELSDFFITPGARVIEIGCSTGALIKRLAERHGGSGADFLGVDIEPEMVALARRRAVGVDSLRIEIGDARSIDYTNAALVVCYYTLQFIPLPDRIELLARIGREMRVGGALVVFEKTRQLDGESQDICNQAYDSFKLDRGFSPEEIVGKTRSLRGVLAPLTSVENQSLVRDAGFSTPWVFFRHLAFEGMLARRSLNIATEVE